MKTFLLYFLYTVATCSICYGLYLLFLEWATRYKSEEAEDRREHPTDLC